MAEAADTKEKEVAKYTFPEESVLAVEANGGLLKTLWYTCSSTGVTVKDAGAMLAHVNGKLHQKKLSQANLVEDPKVFALLEKYIELEKPHRELKKQEQESKGKEYMQKILEMKESMTKEEYKEHQKQKRDEKRARIASGEEEPRPKRTKTIIKTMEPWEDKTPYHCGATGKTLRGYKEVKEHMQSDEFSTAALEFLEGCAICGFKSDDKEKVLEHYLSMTHFKRLHHLAYYGMDVSNWYVGQ